MTEFERIKSMNVVDLAIYINKLQCQAIDDFENGYFPKGIFDNVSMLESEAKENKKLSDKVKELMPEI